MARKREDDEDAALDAAIAEARRQQEEDDAALDAAIAAARRKEKFVEVGEKVMYGLFLAACVILIIVNSLLAYSESGSWFLCILSGVGSFFLGAGELFLIGRAVDEHKIEGSLLHLIWRTMWIAGMVIAGEVLFCKWFL